MDSLAHSLGRESFGTIMYSANLIVVTLKAGLVENAWVWPWTFLAFFGPVLVFFLVFPLFSSWLIPLFTMWSRITWLNNLMGISTHLYIMPTFWAHVLLLIVLCLLPDFVWIIIKRTFWPDLTDTLAAAEK